MGSKFSKAARRPPADANEATAIPRSLALPHRHDDIHRQAKCPCSVESTAPLEISTSQHHHPLEGATHDDTMDVHPDKANPPTPHVAPETVSLQGPPSVAAMVVPPTVPHMENTQNIPPYLPPPLPGFQLPPPSPAVIPPPPTQIYPPQEAGISCAVCVISLYKPAIERVEGYPDNVST
jgi:hypothetical protein